MPAAAASEARATKVRRSGGSLPARQEARNTKRTSMAASVAGNARRARAGAADPPTTPYMKANTGSTARLAPTVRFRSSRTSKVSRPACSAASSRASSMGLTRRRITPCWFDRPMKPDLVVTSIGQESIDDEVDVRLLPGLRENRGRQAGLMGVVKLRELEVTGDDQPL